MGSVGTLSTLRVIVVPPSPFISSPGGEDVGGPAPGQAGEA